MSRKKHLDKTIWENILGTIILFGFIGILVVLTVMNKSSGNQMIISGKITSVFKTDDSYTVIIEDSKAKVGRALVDVVPDTDIKLDTLKQRVVDANLLVGEAVEVVINTASTNSGPVQGTASLIVVK